MLEADIQRGDLIRVLTQYEVTATDFNTAAWLVYPSRSYVPRKVHVFIDFLKAALMD